jgi:hypothetical protein
MPRQAGRAVQGPRGEFLGQHSGTLPEPGHMRSKLLQLFNQRLPAVITKLGSSFFTNENGDPSSTHFKPTNEFPVFDLTG